MTKMHGVMISFNVSLLILFNKFSYHFLDEGHWADCKKIGNLNFKPQNMKVYWFMKILNFCHSLRLDGT